MAVFSFLSNLPDRVWRFARELITRRRVDAVALAVTLAASLAMVFNTVEMPLAPGFDLHSYIALAENPTHFFSPKVKSYHAQRILPSSIVWALREVFPGLSMAEAFRVVSGSAYVAFAALLYFALRLLRVSVLVTVGTTFFTVMTSWVAPYSLYNVYQANDALVYPIVLAMIFAVNARKSGLVIALALVGVLTRQNLFVLGVFAIIALFLKTRKRPLIVGLVAVVAVFYASSRLAGGGAINSLIGHLNIMAVEKAGRGAVQLQIWYLFSPFLLILFNRRALDFVKEYWWLACYCVITIFQPLSVWVEAGAPNVIRIAFQGVFPSFLIAGILIDERMKVPLAKAAYAVLPLLMGTAQLWYTETKFSVLGLDPWWFNVIVILLVLFDGVLWRNQAALRGAIEEAGAGQMDEVRHGVRDVGEVVPSEPLA